MLGDTERHICDLSSGLSAKGADVRSVLPVGCEWKGRLAAASGNEPYEAKLRGGADVISAFRIAGVARKIGSEIIHAHLPRDYPSAAIAAKLSGASLIISHHSSAPVGMFSRLTARNASALVATSYVAGQVLAERFGRERLTGIPGFGTVLERTEEGKRDFAAGFRHEYGIGEERWVVAAVGGLSPGDDLILAANEVIRELPDAYFVVIGWASEGDGPFRRRLRRLVRVFDLENNILFLDKIDELDHLFAAASAFVVTSSSGTADLAALEAMAAGVPVVAVRTGPSGDLIGEGKTTLVSDGKDPVALAANILRLASDKEDLSGIGNSARSFAEEMLTKERIADSTLKVYEAAIA